MYALTREETPIAIEGDGVDLRKQEIGGELTVAFVRLPKGADFTEGLKGLPGDMCQCPHWGYMLKGKVKMRTPDGDKVYEAGQAYYWGAGHVPEALADSEFVEFSPTRELDEVFEHVKAQGG